MDSDDVASLFEDLANGWRNRDYARMAARFASDVVYGDPTRYVLHGRDALLAFFENDDGYAQHIAWHSIVFDERRQSGAAEYTYEGTLRYHGVALFELRGGEIGRWREYQHVDARTFDAFVAGPAPGTTTPAEAEAEIRAMVDRETRAWDERDAEALASLFHPDMVWPWPKHTHAHDPADWLMIFGRFDRRRWVASWRALFDSCVLLHNVRRIATITMSKEGDGALAVVDIDTAWKDADGGVDRWNGRVGKVYARMADGSWKMTMHTGVLEYGQQVELGAT